MKFLLFLFSFSTVYLIGVTHGGNLHRVYSPIVANDVEPLKFVNDLRHPQPALSLPTLPFSPRQYIHVITISRSVLAKLIRDGNMEVVPQRPAIGQNKRKVPVPMEMDVGYRFLPPKPTASTPPAYSPVDTNSL
ncbi:unnamed protein product [Allacma fusca]|uniref:Uncharacterized protein n=1 Tax=Allacma fusca TaxID=39272 RepID=A0A8J2JHY7_9HEXA|nr:unnamed protein product [Allacma fusca]